ncbi:protein FLX-like 1 isoform X2 [Dendrobium catenatum]|uniref:protein FLX-like 1 isoform X2 n=1 Tax=Dendrobium catenatum TaxID=906689 RepID=UPI00109F964B|nr:protein FLX-like 1 isoform X2 [Dendrobium catenatum]
MVHGLAQLSATHHRHPVISDGMRDGSPPFNGGFRGSRLLPQAWIEEQLADQYHEIQGLLLDNQRLTATHVALEQELAVLHHELRRISHAAGSMQAERDAEFREMNAELSAADAMRAELMQVQGEIEKLNAARNDLTAKVQMLTQDMEMASAELQRALAIKAEIEAMKQEVQRNRDAIEYEKKEYADNYEQGQLLEKNLILMARKVEKLRLEVANAEKRAGEGEAAGNQGTCVTFFLQLTDQSCSKNLVL